MIAYWVKTNLLPQYKQTQYGILIPTGQGFGIIPHQIPSQQMEHSEPEESPQKVCETTNKITFLIL